MSRKPRRKWNVKKVSLNNVKGLEKVKYHFNKRNIVIDRQISFMKFEFAITFNLNWNLKNAIL